MLFGRVTTTAISVVLFGLLCLRSLSDRSSVLESGVYVLELFLFSVLLLRQLFLEELSYCLSNGPFDRFVKYM